MCSSEKYFFEQSFTFHTFKPSFISSHFYQALKQLIGHHKWLLFINNCLDIKFSAHNDIALNRSSVAFKDP